MEEWRHAGCKLDVKDPRGFITSHRLADGNVTTHTYTPTGQRATVTDSRGVTSYAYDGQNRLMSVSTPSNGQVSYSYDAAGNRSSMTTPAGTISYRYDEREQLATVADPQDRTFIYQYDPAGNRQHLVYPNGITAEYGYDQLNRLTSIAYHQGSNPPIASYAYTLGPAGNRTAVAEADGSSTQWSYDDSYRLTSETVRDAGSTVTYQAGYSYDPVGNRQSQSVNGTATNYTYNSLDQLTGSVSGSTSTQFSYNGRGDLTQVATTSGNTTYGWDAADRLTSASLPNGTTVSYGFDADGRRVRQSAGSSVTNYLWDEASTYGGVVDEADNSGTVHASYVLGSNELLSQNRGGILSYYLHDGQGSVRALADNGGNVTDIYGYAAFGAQLSRHGTTINTFLYTGAQYDVPTGHYVLRARQYNPAVGRFLFCIRRSILTTRSSR